LTYGLLHAQGEFVTAFGLDEQPDPDQLMKAVAAFAAVGDEPVCFCAGRDVSDQAATLDFCADHENKLWGDCVASHLGESGLPLALENVTPHFRTEDLKRIGGWDAFNRSGDGGLGLRLALTGGHAAHLDSCTTTRRSPGLVAWSREQVRTQRGRLQTWLIGLRSPFQGGRREGRSGLLLSHALIGGHLLALLSVPLLVAAGILFLSGNGLGESGLQSVLGKLVAAAGVAGAVAFVLTRLCLGFYLRRPAGLWAAIVSPIYLLMLSVAAWMALVETVVDPRTWWRGRDTRTTGRNGVKEG
jgi:hypothetical protein